MTAPESRQVLALLNQALEIMAAAEPTGQPSTDWKLQNELRAYRNKLAARVVIPSHSTVRPHSAEMLIVPAFA